MQMKQIKNKSQKKKKKSQSFPASDLIHYYNQGFNSLSFKSIYVASGYLFISFTFTK